MRRKYCWHFFRLAIVVMAIIPLIFSSFPTPVFAASEIISSTSNTSDFRSDNNTIDGGRWSYYDLTDQVLLDKGDGGNFAVDEYAVNINNTNHTSCLKQDGKIWTDNKQIAYNYTVDSTQNGLKLRISGTFTAVGSAHFTIYKTSDTDSSSITGALTTLFDYTGASTSFDFVIDAQAGNDILFAEYNQMYWWEASKINASIDTQNVIRTNNKLDYRTDTNQINGGRWSYIDYTNNNALLVKGSGGIFATDEWCVDNGTASHKWFVKAGGYLSADRVKAIASNYTFDSNWSSNPVRVRGTFSPNYLTINAARYNRIRIILSSDTDPSSVTGPYTTLYEFTGYDPVSFSFTIGEVANGNDLIFVSDNQNETMPPVLDVTIENEIQARVEPITVDKDPGVVEQGTQIALSTQTAGATIYYTTDGSNPRFSVTRTTYSGPITINDDMLIKAYASKDSMIDTEQGEYRYKISTPFRNYIGINQTYNLPWIGSIGGAQWDRMDIYWPVIKTSDGVDDNLTWDAYKKKILDAKNRGVTVLPILCYGADWAHNRNAYSFTEGGYTKSYSAILAEDGYMEQRRCIVTDSNNNVIRDTTDWYMNALMPLDPSKYQAWQDYVTMVVSELSQAPYNIEYFQIWNEAYNDAFTESGFWYGGMDEYINTIHKPAAEIIHNYGGKVVYGGWICNASISGYVGLLDRTSAWDSVDVVDLHYKSLSDMQYLYNEMALRGYQDKSIWQSEVGFTTDQLFLPNQYPRFFFWSLNHWINSALNPDKYKLLFFDCKNEDNPSAWGYHCGLVSGNDLYSHGKAMNALSNLLKSQTIRTFTGYRTTPDLKPQINSGLAATQGFLLDNKDAAIAIEYDQSMRQNYTNIGIEIDGQRQNSALSTFVFNVAGGSGSTTDNINNYRMDTNTVDSGRWSYVSLTDSGLLGQKGLGEGFAEDEWTLSNTNPNHNWYVKANGNIGTDSRQLGYCYTVTPSQAANQIRLTGTYSAVGSGHFQILKTADSDAQSIGTSKTTLFDYTGTGTSFDIIVDTTDGNDILFVSSDHLYWWEPSNIKANISANTSKVAPVVADKVSGEIYSSTQVALSTATPGATIYYTIDGTDPMLSQSRNTYSGPININSDTIIKTYAAKNGMADSDVEDFYYCLADTASSKASTNNVLNYRKDSNTVGGGRWSYYDLTDHILLTQGTGSTFATDEYTVDINNPNHVWCLKENGNMWTDNKQIAYNYTVGQDQTYPLRIKGTYSAVGSGHFKIIQTSDTDMSSVGTTYTTLLDYTGTSRSFDLSINAQPGNDILFVDSDHMYWWEPSTLNATVSGDGTSQVAPVYSDAGKASTNNNSDFRLDSNTLGGGNWSYYDLTDQILLHKGDGNGFATDEYTVDNNNPNHVWCLNSNGEVWTDNKQIAYNYTVAKDQTYPLRIKGTYKAIGSGHFKILQTSDKDVSTVGTNYTTLLDYTGTGTSFDFTINAQPGNDILFVDSDHMYWWEASTINATVSKDGAVQVPPVAGGVAPYRIHAGQRIQLSSSGAGTQIYYTIDGTDPRTSDTRMLYREPVSIDHDIVLKAYAVSSFIDINEIESVKRVDIFGNEQELPFSISNNKFTVNVPIVDQNAEVNSINSGSSGCGVFYVLIKQ